LVLGTRCCDQFGAAGATERPICLTLEAIARANEVRAGVGALEMRDRVG